MRRSLAALSAIAVCAVSSGASAQYFDDVAPASRDVASSRSWAWELRLGPYTPNVGAAFDETFGSDDGWLFATEVDWLPLDIPYVGMLGIGVGFGWAGYSANALIEGTNMRSDEETRLDLFPLTTVGVLRLTVLYDELKVPIFLTGKLGADFVFWSSSTGDTDDGSGIGIGLRWAAQAALVLDVFEPAAARALDEEWSINHSFLYVELFGSTAGGTPAVGGTSVAFGLGLIF